MREALEQAYDDAQIEIEDVIEEEAAEEVVEDEEGEELPEVSDRDEKGRFKKKEAEAPTEEVAEVKEEATEEVKEEETQESSIEPPHSYTATVKAKWNEIPKEVQEELVRREQDVHRMMTAPNGELQIGRQMKEVVTPYMPLIQSLGATPAQAVGETLNLAYILNQGQPLQKAQVIEKLINDHQIDTSLIGQQQTADPQMKALQDQIAQLSQAANPEAVKAQLRQEMEAERINTEVQAFAANPAHIHYDKVRPAMAALLQSGAAGDMQEAYDMACHADPAIRSTLQQEQAKEAEAKRKVEIEAKKKAAASVTGSPGTTSNSSPKQAKSVRDALDSSWEELSSSSI